MHINSLQSSNQTFKGKYIEVLPAQSIDTYVKSEVDKAAPVLRVLADCLPEGKDIFFRVEPDGADDVINLSLLSDGYEDVYTKNTEHTVSGDGTKVIFDFLKSMQENCKDDYKEMLRYFGLSFPYFITKLMESYTPKKHYDYSRPVSMDICDGSCGCDGSCL